MAKTYYTERTPPEAQVEAEIAIKAIGTNAIPHLLGLMRKTDPPAEKALNQLLSRQSLIGFRFQYEEDTVRSHEQALAGFLALGQLSAPAVSELGRMFLETNSKEVIGSTAVALEAMGPASIPVFRMGLTNKNVACRQWSVWNLSHFGSNAIPALPELLRLIQDKSERADIRGPAIRLVTGMQTNWESIVPALTGCLEDRWLGVRALQALGQFGTNAVMAESGIRSAFLTTNENEQLRRIAQDVLQKISPGAENSPKQE